MEARIQELPFDASALSDLSGKLRSHKAPQSLKCRGATPGDLARKQIFPALYAMFLHGALKVPVIGVASSPGTDEPLRARGRISIELRDPACDSAALAQGLLSLHYVSVNYKEAATFDAIQAALGTP